MKSAVAKSGITDEVGKLIDMMKIATYGVFGTPAVVIDGQVKAVGKAPTKDEVKSWLAQ